MNVFSFIMKVSRDNDVSLHVEKPYWGYASVIFFVRLSRFEVPTFSLGTEELCHRNTF